MLDNLPSPQPSRAASLALTLAALAAVSLPCAKAGAQNDFVNFETGQVHPIDTCTVSAGGNARP